ncbi:MAG: regulator SirB [Nitrosomonadaceae bacterium]|nr:regulator SirB [Nitrosomonadaceae bacterium]|tara:strand:- start:474 stop:854 length:381 start_codon:yes stop_codon:yes gene_type:complete
MSFAAIKLIHITSIILSYILFSLRGIWMIQGSPLLTMRWIKFLPHIIDTILLTSAILLVSMIQKYPGFNIWLSAKIGGLFLYILLGMVALRLGKTKKTKTISWILAQIVFFYIVLVALTKNPTLVF